jgi:hypothetical protein
MNQMFSFEVDLIGEESGERFQGSFVYKRLTIGKKREVIQDQILLNGKFKSINELRAELGQELLAGVEGNRILSSIEQTNNMIAFLKHALVECPKWFKDSNYGIDLEDTNVLAAISNKIQEFEDKRAQELLKVLDDKGTK